MDAAGLVNWIRHSPAALGALIGLGPAIVADIEALFRAPENDEDGWARFKHFNWRRATFAYVRGMVLGALGGWGLLPPQ